MRPTHVPISTPPILRLEQTLFQRQALPPPSSPPHDLPSSIALVYTPPDGRGRCALFSAQNMLMCAPTGAGKTNVAMLTMLQTIGMHREGGELELDKFKIVYIAPMKALVQVHT